jgi:hypothetical protein
MRSAASYISHVHAVLTTTQALQPAVVAAAPVEGAEDVALFFTDTKGDFAVAEPVRMCVCVLLLLLLLTAGVAA